MDAGDLRCKTALSRCGIPGMRWSLNPYLGCTHACVYCYAPVAMRFHADPEAWGTAVRAKGNIAGVLEQELRGKKRVGTVLLSSVTDPYQPWEGQRRLTRACLEALSCSDLEVSILTKGDLVTRDARLLASMRATVGFTITSASDASSRLLEPGASPTSARLRALARMAEAGVNTWVFVAPVFPWVVDDLHGLEALVLQCRDAGASYVSLDPMNFYPGPTRKLLAVLDSQRPAYARHLQWALCHRQEYAAMVRDVAGYLGCQAN